MELAESASARLVTAVLKNLAAERVRRGLTQEELALRADIDRTHVGLLEKGRRSPSLEVALRLAWALNLSLADLLTTAGDRTAGATDPQPLVPAERVRRRPIEAALRKSDHLMAATALASSALLEAVEKTYATLDLIDAQLVKAKSPPLAATVELANLSSMLGNLIGAAIAAASGGLYKRNGPHKYPDLLPQKPRPATSRSRSLWSPTNPRGTCRNPGRT